MTEVTLDDLVTYTLGIIVYFVGVYLNRNFKLLREYNIPEPVSGGLLAAGLLFFTYLFLKVEINFEMDMRDRLLVYFFTAIGLNARISDLLRGGKTLLVFLLLTLTYIVIQNVVGISGAQLLGLSREFGVLAGSTSLIGGHGTAIAWAPEYIARGIPNALEVGVASATLGLVIASLVGGPIARFLISRNQLSSSEVEEAVGIAYAKADSEKINHMSLMAVILALHVAIFTGYMLNEAFAAIGFKLPLFVASLLSAIVLSNTIPTLLPKLSWPAHTRALAMVSDFSLGLFLAMSLMSMQLWTIANLAGPLLTILLLQTVTAVLFILFVLFPAMGRDYQASVLCAGFGGFTLGATPTAIANMTAVTKANGPAPLAFVILPLVAAIFVDIANALIIRAALAI